MTVAQGEGEGSDGRADAAEPVETFEAFEVSDGPGYIVRARRLADLSQRDLADEIGVSRATVGRLESGAIKIDVLTLAAILARAGLRLAVLDRENRELDPVPVDVLRDHAGRRFPGHLDVRPPQDAPSDRVHPRRGVPDARGWYEKRPARAGRRSRQGTPDDHPTVSGLREARRAAYWEGVAAAQARRAADPEVECSCFDACFERACLADCPCQCEPDHRSRLRPSTPTDEL